MIRETAQANLCKHPNLWQGFRVTDVGDNATCCKHY